MCTVAFIPVGNEYFLTANRDEQWDRPAAQPPGTYRVNGQKILFPMDPRSGGTWFAVNENGHAVVFLNGAFEKHIPGEAYRKSRGLILLDLASAVLPTVAFERADLDQIEPFTAIIVEFRNLYICRWDGLIKTRRKLDESRSHIWSSVTLYDSATAAKRALWFDSWMSKNPHPSISAVLDFHRHAGDGDLQNDLVMNRNNLLLTHNICTAFVSENSAVLHYLDLLHMAEVDSSLSFLNTIPVIS
jgi:hypothetical protein